MSKQIERLDDRKRPGNIEKFAIIWDKINEIIEVLNNLNLMHPSYNDYIPPKAEIDEQLKKDYDEIHNRKEKSKGEKMLDKARKEAEKINENYNDMCIDIYNLTVDNYESAIEQIIKERDLFENQMDCNYDTIRTLSREYFDDRKKLRKEIKEKAEEIEKLKSQKPDDDIIEWLKRIFGNKKLDTRTVLAGHDFNIVERLLKYFGVIDDKKK